MHITEAAGLSTAAHHTDDLRPPRGIGLGILISAFCWLAFAVAIVAAVVP